MSVEPAFRTAIFACVLLLSCAATAQPKSGFGRAGSPAFSGERLMGVFVNDVSLDGDGSAAFGGMDVDLALDTEGTTTTFALLGNGTDAGPAGVPRFAFDYFLIDSFSIGGSLVYASSREEREEATGIGMLPDTRVDVDETTSLLTFSPRAGYGMMFTDHIGVWGRAGLAYTRFSAENERTQREPDTDTIEDTETTAHLWNIVLDAQLILSPIDHVGFAVGPHLGIPLTGSFEVINNLNDGSIEGDASLTDYGISAGMLFWL
jgi:opacity protein-like surface antigen